MSNIPLLKHEYMLKTEEFNKLQELLPDNIKSYYDPFCGNMGLSTYVLKQKLAEELHISDKQQQLMDFYFIIAYKLNDFLGAYDSVVSKKIDFYKVRKRFNETEQIIEKALTFLLLNKMVNGVLSLKDGKCLQGRGKHMVNWKMTREKLITLSEDLKNKNVLMYQKQFTDVINIDEIKEDDFIYLDVNYNLSSIELEQLRNICENVKCKWIIKINNCLSSNDISYLKEDYYIKDDKYIMNYN